MGHTHDDEFPRSDPEAMKDAIDAMMGAPLMPRPNQILGQKGKLIAIDEAESVDTSNMIFVFGSNEAGVHGAGAAKFAYQKRGAVYGKGLGHHGQSFAIPTKNTGIKTLKPYEVRHYVDVFVQYAKKHPELTFQITAIGCGLAGFKHSEIAPMFIGSPDNCYFDELWKPWLDNVKFWGTF